MDNKSRALAKINDVDALLAKFEAFVVDTPKVLEHLREGQNPPKALCCHMPNLSLTWQQDYPDGSPLEVEFQQHAEITPEVTHEINRNIAAFAESLLGNNCALEAINFAMELLAPYNLSDDKLAICFLSKTFRACDVQLCLQNGCIYMDFKKANGKLQLLRMSFDGFGKNI